jgi:hypothetical protein
VPFEPAFVLAGGNVPQAHRPVVAARRQRQAVGREGQAKHRVGVPGQGPAKAGLFRIPGDDFPEFNRPVIACGGQRLAVGGERHGVDRLGVALEGGEQAPGGHVAQLHGAARAAGGQGLAVGAVRQAQHHLVVRGAVVVRQEVGLLLAAVHVPEPERLVGAAAGQCLAVTTEGDGVDPGRVSGQAGDLLARGRLPQPHRLVRAGGGQELAVRGERHARHAALVARQFPHFLAARDVPDARRRVGPAGGQRLAVRSEGDGRDGTVMPFEHDLLRAGGVPNLDAAVLAPRGNCRAGGGKRRAAHAIRRGAQPRAVLAGRHVAEPHGPVGAGAEERLAVGRERHAVDRVVLPRPADTDLAGGGVTEPDGAVLFSRRHGLAVRGVGDRADRGGGADGGRLLTRCRVPEAKVARLVGGA